MVLSPQSLCPFLKADSKLARYIRSNDSWASFSSARVTAGDVPRPLDHISVPQNHNCVFIVRTSGVGARERVDAALREG